MTDTPESTKARLHAILAVEGDLAGKSKMVLAETVKVFQRGDMFQGHTRTLKMIDENRSHEEEAGGERHALPTTVGKRLDYTAKAVTRYLDAYYQKERTNQIAKADIIVDGTVIASEVPATALLGLEKRLHEIRGVYEVMPTLDQGIEWEEDPSQGDGVWRNKYPDVRSKTEKLVTVVSLAAATKEHKEQVQTVTKDVPVGKFTTCTISGMVTSAEKAVRIGKVDQLIQAVKQARTRANSVAVVEGEIGKKLFDFINAS